MRLANKKSVFVSAFLAAWLVYPLAGLAQDSGSGDGDFVLSPRNNVRGGAIEGRRPGRWTSASIAYHAQRQQTVLRQFGGVEPVPESEIPPPRKQVLLTAFLDSVFDGLINALDQYMILLKAGDLFGSDGSSTEAQEEPEPV